MSSQNTYETEAGETECECGCCGFIAGMETAIDGRVWLGTCDKCGKDDFCSSCAQMNEEGECVCLECAEKCDSCGKPFDDEGELDCQCPLLLAMD